MKSSAEFAANLHKNVPPDWYFQSIRRNVFQRYWHRKRFREVAKLVELTEGRILDIGSADGVFTNEILRSSGASEVVGIEVLAKSVSWAKNHWRGQRKLKFKVEDAHNLDFRSGYFDAVFALEVLEHVENPEKVLSEIKRVLKKGGYAVILVPTDSFLFQMIWWFLTNYWWAKIWNDCHIQSFKKESLVKISKKSGFVVEENKRFHLGMLQALKLRNK